MKIVKDAEGHIAEESFRAWARENYQPFTEIQAFWHPIVAQECARINMEAASDDVGEDEITTGVYQSFPIESSLPETIVLESVLNK